MLQKIKAILLGESGVGKSALVTRFMYGVYDSEHITTLGVDYFTKDVTRADGYAVRMCVWDTAGQERFNALNALYVRDSTLVFVVFDMSSRQSFALTHQWIAYARRILGEDTPIVLVGNKSDLQQRVSEHEMQLVPGIAMALRVSAKDNTNVRALFSRAVSIVTLNLEPVPVSCNGVVNLHSNGESEFSSDGESLDDILQRTDPALIMARFVGKPATIDKATHKRVCQC